MNNKTYKDYIYMNMVNYSDKELMIIHGEMEAEHEKYVEIWAKEAAELVNSGIDPFSFWGERKLNKLAKKHADVISDINIILENIENELDKRERIAEEERYMGKGFKYSAVVNKEKFIQEEQIKTLSHKTDDEF